LWSIYMMNKRNSPLALLITPESLLGMICASADVSWVPANPWPLEIALETLARSLEHESALGRAVAAWPPARHATPRFSSVSAVILRLASGSEFTPTGTGWEAGYVPSPKWRTKHGELLRLLPSRERRAVRLAGQRLMATLTTLSKNVAVSGPLTSATI